MRYRSYMEWSLNTHTQHLSLSLFHTPMSVVLPRRRPVGQMNPSDNKGSGSNDQQQKEKSSNTGVMLPSAVLERLPALKEATTLFFDFGMQHNLPPVTQTPAPHRFLPQQAVEQQDSQPVVVVLTDQQLFIASFPQFTRPAITLPLKSISGIQRNADRVSSAPQRTTWRYNSPRQTPS